MQNDTKQITLSALSERIRLAIEGGAGALQWVVAEVSSIQVNYSGHCYIELIERNAGGQMPMAICRAVIWSSRFKLISAYFRHSTACDISVGMKILVQCTATYHAVYGLSLVISDIDPAYTVGEVERVRQQTIARLEKEGVIGMNKEFALPVVIQRVAVVSSITAAGYGDFCNELERSVFKFDFTLFQATMQGDTAQSSIIEALENVAQGEYDAVIIIRGGGSVSDLACFDSYLLCANIAQFPMPVITGIGHERDVSAADMVACHSLKTPTAVASFMVELASVFYNRLDKALQYIIHKSQQVALNESNRVENVALYLSKIVKQYIYNNGVKVNTIESTIASAANAALQRNINQRNFLVQSLQNYATQNLINNTNIQSQLIISIRNIATTRMSAEHHRVEIISMSVQANNPRNILSRGYAIVNRGIRSLDNLEIGDDLSIDLADGVIKAKVNEKWKTKN